MIADLQSINKCFQKWLQRLRDNTVVRPLCFIFSPHMGQLDAEEAWSQEPTDRKKEGREGGGRLSDLGWKKKEHTHPSLRFCYAFLPPAIGSKPSCLCGFFVPSNKFLFLWNVAHVSYMVSLSVLVIPQRTEKVEVPTLSPANHQLQRQIQSLL